MLCLLKLGRASYPTGVSQGLPEERRAELWRQGTRHFGGEQRCSLGTWLTMTGQVMEAALQQRYAGTATIPLARYLC